MKEFKIVLLFFRMLEVIKNRRKPEELNIDGITVSEYPKPEYAKTAKSSIIIMVPNGRVAQLLYAILITFNQKMYSDTAKGLRGGNMEGFISVMFDEADQQWYRTTATSHPLNQQLTLTKLVNFLEEETHRRI